MEESSPVRALLEQLGVTARSLGLDQDAERALAARVARAAGVDAPTDVASGALRGVLESVIEAGPPAWHSLASSGLQTLEGPLGGVASPALRSWVNALLEAVGDGVVRAMDPLESNESRLDTLVLPLLQRIGDACVDALLDERR
jgi:hypothetical protein